MSNEFFNIVTSVLNEGDGQEGFDLPFRYPLKRNNIFKQVIFPASLRRGTKRSEWYVECKPNASNKWAEYRAAAAQLRRNGIPQSQISSEIHVFLNDYPPQTRNINNQQIPNGATNIIYLK